MRGCSDRSRRRRQRSEYRLRQRVHGPPIFRRAMTPRGTAWGLAALVPLLGITGALTAFAGTHSRAWVFVAHGTAGFALALLLVPKLRRVRRRLGGPHAGVVAAAVVAL